MQTGIIQGSSSTYFIICCAFSQTSWSVEQNKLFGAIMEILAPPGAPIFQSDGFSTLE